MRALITVLITLGLTAGLANAEGLDPAASYSCVISQSSDSGAVGAALAGRLTVESLKRGFLLAKSATGQTLIDFYGPLQEYNLLAQSSGLQAFSTIPTQPREIHGSVVVTKNQKGGFELAIKIFPTTRAFDQTGAQAFIFADEPQVYKLTCTL